MGLGQEAHGGSTYCAVASLALMRKLDRIRYKHRLVQWCMDRQGQGFQGRPAKPPDTCYSFWIGAAMKLLGSNFFPSRYWRNLLPNNFVSLPYDEYLWKSRFQLAMCV